jgi:hypothetical protein
VSIVDVHARLPAREVLATHAAAHAAMFFHNDSVVPEPNGFWLPGRSRLAVTVAASHLHPPRLRLRAGPVPTRLRLIAPGWQQDVTLEPRAQRDVVLPIPATDVTRLVFETSTGFVPASLDWRSHDRRLLSCWVELDPPDPL